MITLSAPKSLPNFTRWEVDDWEAHEKQGIGQAVIILHTGAPTNYTLQKTIFIRNFVTGGRRTDKIGYVATVGGPLGEQLTVTEDAISSPASFTDAHAAYLAGVGGRPERLQALAAYLLTAGIADSSLAGS
jgi:hypothetical protein